MSHTVQGGNVEQRSDRELIIDLINGVGVGADDHDWERCRSSFINEPLIDYSSLSGQPGGPVKATELIEGWSGFLPKFAFTQHFITNHEIRVGKDGATCRSYVHAIHHLPGAEGGDLWGVYGIYTHSLVKTASAWRISAMTFQLLYQEGNTRIPVLAAGMAD